LAPPLELKPNKNLFLSRQPRHTFEHLIRELPGKQGNWGDFEDRVVSQILQKAGFHVKPLNGIKNLPAKRRRAN
jgi:hypothetical protein